jgi:hypothetical protein
MGTIAMSRFSCGLAMTAALLAAGTALADDSTAELGAGGLVFTRNTPVRMASEDLYISPVKVRIRFVFANDTAKDVETVVAFPLPDIDTAQFYASGIGAVTDDPVNFVGFKTAIGGKPVAFKVEQRAFVKGKDVTALLVAAGAPVNPVIGDGFEKLAKLSADAFKRLKAAGVVDGDPGDVVPRWTVRTRFYWTQRFPAHGSVVIDHSYQPVTGGSFFSRENLTGQYGTNEVAAFCIDAATRARIAAKSDAAKKTNPGNNGLLSSFWTDYILMTANNWNGPIGRFHLTLDKLKPGNVLSLCWKGDLKKTGPTTFESTLTNFSPAQDIRMLVVSDMPTE